MTLDEARLIADVTLEEGIAGRVAKGAAKLAGRAAWGATKLAAKGAYKAGRAAGRAAVRAGKAHVARRAAAKKRGQQIRTGKRARSRLSNIDRALKGTKKQPAGTKRQQAGSRMRKRTSRRGLNQKQQRKVSRARGRSVAKRALARRGIR